MAASTGLRWLRLVAWMERIIHCDSVISFCCLIRRMRKKMVSIKFSVSGMNQHHGSYVDMDLPRQRASYPLELVSISQMVTNEVTHIGSMSMPMSSTSHHFVSHRELHGQQMKLLCDLQQRRSSLVRSIMPQVRFLELALTHSL